MLAQVAERRLAPLFYPDEAKAPPRARDLTVERCPPPVAVALNERWHSRLPKAQAGPWMYAFAAHYEQTAFGVALWHNPSARGLPQEWLELRRLAVAPDAPHCTASRMLGVMARWFKQNTDCPRLISYQDVDVHLGTIYRAAGWTEGFFTKPRVRDRTPARRGTNRAYRSDLNGTSPAGAGKVRWELEL